MNSDMDLLDKNKQFLKTIDRMVVTGKNNRIKYRFLNFPKESAISKKIQNEAGVEGDVFLIFELDKEGKALGGEEGIGFFILSPFDEHGYFDESGRLRLKLPLIVLRHEKDRGQNLLSSLLARLNDGAFIQSEEIVNHETILKMVEEIYRDMAERGAGSEFIERYRPLWNHLTELKEKDRTGTWFSVLPLLEFLFEYQKKTDQHEFLASLKSLFQDTVWGQSLRNGGFSLSRVYVSWQKDKEGVRKHMLTYEAAKIPKSGRATETQKASRRGAEKAESAQN